MTAKCYKKHTHIRQIPAKCWINNIRYTAVRLVSESTSGRILNFAIANLHAAKRTPLGNRIMWQGWQTLRWSDGDSRTLRAARSRCVSPRSAMCSMPRATWPHMVTRWAILSGGSRPLLPGISVQLSLLVARRNVLRSPWNDHTHCKVIHGHRTEKTD